jgi:hypothetical protein
MWRLPLHWDRLVCMSNMAPGAIFTGRDSSGSPARRLHASARGACSRRVRPEQSTIMARPISPPGDAKLTAVGPGRAHVAAVLARLAAVAFPLHSLPHPYSPRSLFPLSGRRRADRDWFPPPPPDHTARLRAGVIFPCRQAACGGGVEDPGLVAGGGGGGLGRTSRAPVPIAGAESVRPALSSSWPVTDRCW